MAKKSFSADVEQLIQLVTHSVYSNKEIFLRELISNANDAIQKSKLKSAEDANYLGDETEFKIQIDIDKDKKIIKITDTGIGMTTKEVEEHIGTIAKSGTAKFLENLKKAKNEKKNKQDENGISSNLIGQFGIGFYSAFMVANKVELETKSNDDSKATLRVSEGKGTYELKSSKKTTRGTEITLYLQDESEGFLKNSRLKSLIKKHNNYIPVPIMMEKEAEKDEKDKKGKKDKKGEKNKKNKKGEKREYEQVNEMKSIWTRRKTEIKKEEYEKFYQTNYFDQNKPLDTLHIQTEGALSYKSLLFIPQKENQFAMMTGGGDNRDEFGPDLYVQNILIKEKTKDLLPVWLRFVKGIVETNDLSLNMSRELLQNSPIINKLQKSLTKKVLKSLARQKKKNFDNYLEFHNAYGRVLKEGIHFDFENKEKIAEIVLFNSMKKDKMITLDEYIKKAEDAEKAKKDINTSVQNKTIYYIVGTSKNELMNSPYLSKFKKNYIDVVLMTDPVDEYVINALKEFKGYKFKLASDKDVSLLDEKEKKKTEKEVQKAENDNKNFIAFFKSTIGKEKLNEIHFSKDLGNAIALISTKEGQQSAQMQKIMKAMGKGMGAQAKDIQINIDHQITQKILTEYSKNPKSDDLKDMVHYIYDQAIILEGGEIENLSNFISRVNKLLGG